MQVLHQPMLAQVCRMCTDAHVISCMPRQTVSEYRGQSVVKQHQLVTKVLEDEISKWHGFVLETKAT